MGGNSFRVEGVAYSVDAKKLYDFWTDYGPEDVEIMRKHGMTMALERVSKREGNHVVVDTTAKIMGMRKNMRYDILLYPEQYRLEMTIRIEGLAESHRTYSFRAVPEGTRLLVEDEYEPVSVLARMMNMVGMLRKRLVKDTTRTMEAFLDEAEERFAVSAKLGNASSQRGLTSPSKVKRAPLT